MDDLEQSVGKQTLRLWRAWRTLHEMVSDRGYHLSEEEIKISVDEFGAKFSGPDGNINRGILRFSARPSPEMIENNTPLPTAANPEPTADVGPIYVEFLGSDSLGVAAIRKFLDTAANEGYRSGILVTHVAVSPGARKYLASVESLVRVECFIEEDLLINITKHELVPQHTLISYAEKLVLLKRYRLKETQLPRIHQTDPIAKYYGLRRGQVVKIIRLSQTAGRYASYRLCV